MWCSLLCPSPMRQRCTDRPCSRPRNRPVQGSSTLTGCMQSCSHSESRSSLVLVLIHGSCLIYLVYLCRNKNSMESLSRLVIHPHQGSVYSACFSHDGTKIASSGACKTLKVSAVSLSQFHTRHCIKCFIHTDCRVTVLYRGV